MSTTYHYDAMLLTIDKCFEILKGKDPMVIKEGDRYKLLWNDEFKNENSRHSVWLRKIQNDNYISIDKCCGENIIDGQGKLLDYLSKNNINHIWCD